MKILAIETSCDDTGVAVLEIKGNKSPSFSILSNIISSQIEIHKKYGGVYPAMAKREHQKNLVPVLIKALKQAKLLNQKPKTKNQNYKLKIEKLKNILNREEILCKKLISFFKKYEKPEVDLIAVTNGPGLEPCLWVGINFAKALSYFWDIPIVPVNHIESHILVNFIKHETWNMKQIFPVVCLVVSGGHTQIILMEKIGKYKILGETRDDAAGECFDKCAKILGLGYPGGPIIAKLANKFVGHRMSHKIPRKLQLPRPMINTKDYDFSFSGLKTAVLYHHKKQAYTNIDDRQKSCRLKYKQEMAAEIQQAIIDVLIKKTIKAAKDYKAKSIILGGGVSANEELRKQFQTAVFSHCEEVALGDRRSNLNLIFPPANLSTDNALMTAVAGYFHRNKKIARTGLARLKADGNLRIK